MDTTNVRSPKTAAQLHPNANKQGCCGFTSPVNYSHGYPKHPYHVPDRVNPALVATGYQDQDVLDAQRVAALGRNDAHKRPFFHPSNKSCGMRPLAYKRQGAMCASLRR